MIDDRWYTINHKWFKKKKKRAKRHTHAKATQRACQSRSCRSRRRVSTADFSLYAFLTFRLFRFRILPGGGGKIEEEKWKVMTWCLRTYQTEETIDYFHSAVCEKVQVCMWCRHKNDICPRLYMSVPSLVHPFFLYEALVSIPQRPASRFQPPDSNL